MQNKKMFVVQMGKIGSIEVPCIVWIFYETKTAMWNLYLSIIQKPHYVRTEIIQCEDTL